MTVYSNTQPNTNDDLGTTVRKILQVVNNSSGGGGNDSNYIVIPPTSSGSPGTNGNYSYDGTYFYFYYNGWKRSLGSAF